jgi:3-hydroxyisobutyrate dehydrogenase
MSKPRIGFIGIGVMGAPMSGNLAKAGYTLTIHDINRANVDRVAEAHEGIMAAETPRAIAEVSDIVITMLPSGEYVREVALGDNGLIDGFRAGALLLDTSSSEPWLTVETAGALADKGVDMVDAPVSGALAGAQAAELVFMVGGEKGPVSRVSPLLQIMGKKVFHLGPVGAGHTMKCINNLITALTFMATVEGLTIGKQFGLDPNVMTDVLNLSTGMSWISQTHIKQRITSRKFDDPFRLDLMVKDMGIAMELARRKGLPLPLSGLGQHLWKAAARYSAEGGSISNMVRWVEHMTGTEITLDSGR